jgi:hypothetical protein
MRIKLTVLARLAWVTVAALFLMAGMSRSSAAELKLEAQLIWGTNDAKSPDPSHKPVAADVAKKLKTLPFKWANYFEVTRKQFAVPESGVRSETMSKECEIRVKNLGKTVVELSLVGRGAAVGKITQALPKGELLVTGGNAPNFTAWFVVLKQTE